LDDALLLPVAALFVAAVINSVPSAASESSEFQGSV
jgi:hypothetical protein